MSGPVPRLRAATADDLRRFVDAEAQGLTLRWRFMAPLAIAIVTLSEAASYVSSEFPPTPVLTLAVLGTLGVVWLIALRGASRLALGIASIVATCAAAILISTTAALSGRFTSMHVLALTVILGLQAALLSLTWFEVAIMNVLTIGIWLGINLLYQRPEGGVPLDGLPVAGTFLTLLAIVVTIGVYFQRRLRFREFMLRREIEEMHRFAVQDVLMRHLPPGYVEQILSGARPIDGPPERRVVTIVFADIVAFTPIADELPPEKLAHTMASFYDTTSNLAFEHGATIDKFIGDAVMAVIGVTDSIVPSEQVRRALALAEAWHMAIPRLLPMRDGAIPRLRVGIHQDSVIVGSFGGRRRTDYTVLGMGVNVASRLEAICPPGKTLVSREVYDQLDPRPAAEELSELELKGLPRKITAYALTPPKATAR